MEDKEILEELKQMNKWSKKIYNNIIFWFYIFVAGVVLSIAIAIITSILPD